MRAAFISSGDLIADRRYQYAQALEREGDFVAAIDLYEQAIERAPNWPTGYWSLGKAKREIADRAGAAAAFRECLRLDPDDMLGASLALAELDAAVTIDAAPAAYVRALFDAYAEGFDKALVERLSYSTPQTLAALIARVRKGGGRFTRALDLGCGTGLAGEAIVANVAWLEGVDLSEGMINEARAKGVYDKLEHADIMSALHKGGEFFDLILAADVLNYFGELGKVVKSVAGRLADGGLFAFSVEKGVDADWSVQASLRFAHSPSYIGRIAKEAGLELLAMEDTVLRKDRGADVGGLLFVARKPRRAAMNLPSIDGSIMMDAPSSVH